MNDDLTKPDAVVKKFRDKLDRELLNGLPNEQDRRAECLRLDGLLPPARNQTDPAPRRRERQLVQGQAQGSCR